MEQSKSLPRTISVPNLQIPPPSLSPKEDCFDRTHYRGFALLSNPFDNRFYTMPPISSYDAYSIWRQAKIPERTILRTIETKLVDWMYEVASFEIEEYQILNITYSTKDNRTLHFTSWHVFLRWITCVTNPTHIF